MANEEQLERLKRSVEEWNQWREENPDENVELSQADLREADLTDANLRGINLSSASFIDAGLKNAALSYANFLDVGLRGANPSKANLSKADLSGANLSGADLSGANLRGADLDGANLRDTRIDGTTNIPKKWRLVHTLVNDGGQGRNLEYAKLSEANLRGADLRNAKLRNVDLKNADLKNAVLSYANLTGANLSKAKLFHTNLSGANLSGANLSGSNLSSTLIDDRTVIDEAWRIFHSLVNEGGVGRDFRGATLNQLDLSGLDLSHTNLSEAQVLGTNFSNAILTGACIADWQISRSTKFEGIQCDYIFRSYNKDTEEPTDRLPVDPNSTFKPGEFEQWIAVRQGALDTIDITFTEGIDWQAFFQSLQNTRQQHPEAAVRMQAVQEVNGSYVASLQLETEVVGDALEQLRATIESEVKDSYALQLAEARGEIKALERSLEKTLTMGSNNIHQTFNASVGNNIVGTNWGNVTATINNNYGAQADDIIHLLTTLRESAQSFPDEEKETAQVHIEDLTTDLAQERPNPARLKTRIVSLLTVAIALGTHIATATDFANNVLELSQKLDVPAQTLEPQLQQLKQLHPDFQWNPGE